MCSISLSRGFCSPLFLYLLYHKYPDLSIVFSKKNKNFFTFSGQFAALPFLALVSKNCLNYQNLVNFGGARPCAEKKRKERLPALFFLYVSCVYSVCSCFCVCECFGVKRFFDYVNIAVKIVSCGIVMCNRVRQGIKIFVLSVSFIKHCARVEVEYSVNDFFHNFFLSFCRSGTLFYPLLTLLL